MDTSTIAFIIMGVILVLFITEKIPLALTSIGACVAFAVTGIVPVSAAFSGFSNDAVFLVVGMMILGDALFETGVAQVIGKKIGSLVGTSERAYVTVVMLGSAALGIVLSNSATVALMLPITATVAAASGGKITKKNTYMMIGMATVIGGGLTLVGSPPQLMAQGMLIVGGHQPMGFFEPSLLTLPMLLLLLVYYHTIGRRLQNKLFNFPEVEDTESAAAGQPDDEKPKSVVKMWIVVAALVFCIIGFVSEWWTIGTVSMIGAIVCIGTGCISQKKAFQKMNWSTVVIIGASFGIAAGFEQSGASGIVANGLIRLFGDNMTPWLLCAMLALVALVFTNFMSSTAMAAILVPIAIFTALELGYDVKSVVMITVIAGRAGLATPISTAPMTMTLAGGYRFRDYVKVGGLYNLLTFGLILLLIPFILGM